ncbi:hypothetical protein LTR17_025758 [Elasticomyces elasticus]|nr:hypothetical protein LTR17_025758 [Elasticomyces elasticus]
MAQPSDEVARRARAALRVEIEEAIADYTEPDTKPPYSTPQLVAMAAICSYEIEVTDKGVLRWILETFPYYTQQAIHEYITHSFANRTSFFDDFQTQEEPGRFEASITKALGSYALPLRTALFEYEDDQGNNLLRTGLKVLVAPARISLRSVLESSRDGKFQFLELPPEMRNAVYEVLLVFNKHGFTVPFGKKHMCLESREAEEYDPKISTDAGNVHRNLQQVTAPPPATILALLCTCKQVYQEAMPYFYRDNRFRFQYLADFASWSKCLAPSRLEQLSNLYLDVSILYKAEYEDVISALQSLTAIKHLQKLELSFTSGDNEWLKMDSRMRQMMGVQRSRSFTKVEQIPMFSALALVASRATELVITRDRPPHEKIEKYLTTEVKRLKQAEAEKIQKATEIANGSVKKALGRSKTGVMKRTKRQEALAAKAKTKG